MLVFGLLLQFHLQDGLFSSMLDKVAKCTCATQDARGVAQAEADGADQRALAGAVWPDDHVQVRAEEELGLFVRHKVLEFDSHDGSGLKGISRGVIRPTATAPAGGSSLPGRRSFLPVGVSVGVSVVLEAAGALTSAE